MAPSRGDLQRALRLLLAVHLGQVVLHGVCRPRAVQAPRRGRDELFGEQVVDDRGQGHARDHLQAVDQRGFGRVFRRHEDALVTQLAETASRDQDAIHVAHRSIQRKLAQEGAPRRSLLLRPRQGDGDRDRQVKARAFLAQLRRRQVDRQARMWKLKVAVSDRRAHTLASFLDRRGREADQEELDVAATADVGLDLDAPNVQAHKHA